jgi:cell division protein FtsA
VFHMPVRMGMPKYMGGLSEVVRNPVYSTGVGLIQFGHLNRGPRLNDTQERSGFKSVFERMRSWFQGNF